MPYYGLVSIHKSSTGGTCIGPKRATSGEGAFFIRPQISVPSAGVLICIDTHDIHVNEYMNKGFE